MTDSIFVEDLVDRGPDSPGVLRLVMDLVAAGMAMCVQPNHDRTSLRKLNGRDVRMTHGLSEALAQLDASARNTTRSWPSRATFWTDCAAVVGWTAETRHRPCIANANRS